jgi:hypothetical protein
MMSKEREDAYSAAVGTLCRHGRDGALPYARTVGILKAHLEFVAYGFETPEKAIDAIIALAAQQEQGS